MIIFLIGVIKRKLAQSPQIVKDGSEQESEPNYEDIPSPTREKETAFNSLTTVAVPVQVFHCMMLSTLQTLLINKRPQWNPGTLIH